MKNILLAVCGLSPQVITETLYALHMNRQKVDAVHVITTRDGKGKIYSELLSGESGHYYRYLKEYGIDPTSIDFGHKNIHAVTDAHGNEIADIADEEDNERLLKKCLELSFHLTKNSETAVFFSVAGGRKTMSSCLALAAQMYGRQQDRLYHVLVTPEFESNRNFFYPPQASQAIELKDGQGRPYVRETRYAAVNLIHMPFFSIRSQLSSEMLKAPEDPAALMLSLVKEGRHPLVVNLLAGKIIYKNMEFDMMPAHLALFAFFAMIKKNCEKEAETCRDCTDCFLDAQSAIDSGEIKSLYRKLAGAKPIEEMSDTGITNLNKENFHSFKAKIKKDLQERFGTYALKELEIASIGTRPDKRYGLRIDKSKIEMVI
jgi:CRISPR-associated protein Csx14